MNFDVVWIALGGGILAVVGLTLARIWDKPGVVRGLAYIAFSLQLVALTLAVLGAEQRNKNWELSIRPDWDVLGVLAGVALGGLLSHLTASRTWKREKAWELLDLLAQTRELLWHPTPYNRLRTHLLRLRSLLQAFGLPAVYYLVIETHAVESWSSSVQNYESAETAAIPSDILHQFDEAILATETAVEADVKRRW